MAQGSSAAVTDLSRQLCSDTEALCSPSVAIYLQGFVCSHAWSVHVCALRSWRAQERHCSSLGECMQGRQQLSYCHLCCFLIRKVPGAAAFREFFSSALPVGIWEPGGGKQNVKSLKNKRREKRERLAAPVPEPIQSLACQKF